MSITQRLLVLWTSGDREVALKSALMYAHNASCENWWDDVRLLIWGPSAKLVVEDVELQEKIQQMGADGVDIIACKACSDSYDASEKLEELGVNVFYVGESLTEMLQSGWTVLTY